MVLALFLWALPACAQTPDAAYRADFRKWQQEQVRDLKENWLPLVGLFWLKEGDNSFGADEHASVFIARDFLLAHEGDFRLSKGQVWFRAVPMSNARLGKASFREVLMTPSPPGPPTTLEVNTLRIFIIQRGERFLVRVKDLNSLAVREFTGPETYPLSTAYIVKADFTPGNGRTMSVPNVLGDKQVVPVAGQVRFRLHGQELRLDAMEGEDGGLFIIFSDLTKKKDTYPGGRFLDTVMPKDGKVILDFNKAYSPPCAWTPYATCPLPPKQNQLQVEIPAGEKYAGHR